MAAMNICFFAQDFQIEPGATQSMLGLIKKLKEDGHKVIVVLVIKGTIEPALDEMDVQYYYCRTSALTRGVDESPQKRIGYFMKKWGSYLNILRLSRKLKNEDIDIVHINKATGHFGAVLAKKIHVPYVWHFREFLTEDYGRQFVEEERVYRLMRNANKRIAISGAIKGYWERQLNADLELVYNGIDDSLITYAPDSKFIHDEYRILLAGTIVEGKRQLDALKAVNKLKNKYRIKLTIIGKVLSETYHKTLVDYISTNLLENMVNLLDYTENLDELRRNYDIGLLCSEKEAFGRVTIETMLEGLLFIGTDSGGTSELVENGVTGLLYKPGDVDCLVEQIEFAFNHVEMMKKIIANARKQATKYYTLDNTYVRIKTIYNSLLDEYFIK